MKLNDTCYDVLKWVAVICLPAIGCLYTGVAQIWSLPFAVEVSQTLDVVGTILGLMLGISTSEYNKEKLTL